jgi:hypothetical protein
MISNLFKLEAVQSWAYQKQEHTKAS